MPEINSCYAAILQPCTEYGFGRELHKKQPVRLERTNERSLFANEQSEQWQVTSKDRSPSKLATKKNKKTTE